MVAENLEPPKSTSQGRAGELSASTPKAKLRSRAIDLVTPTILLEPDDPQKIRARRAELNARTEAELYRDGVFRQGDNWDD
ncbi:hypothetical protein A2686_00685 [Candidatus Woesebacteria bacterium RIFCSPHIGHO2_01_FULL_38_10]|uniref:Uncharacterized protein n=1 Tax=Candidatus Woesebacteria bacterium RIFCSPLOWO2_01_FULL_39_10b TaxID=1802517 RepID=A0A1F8BB15_9BACT|nr:MAG: hypothetical protein A2686_00685 [Candidatus Woesebacteria bacterium RIFCSPHIGHO2_01_FULL_38_10]OGM60548.1 MAG: hypothetical protein A2892_00825 [Candidatus Woesebacteria bacterium RIFCSPLOWO2_01_FULL_39_10b]